jgi:hypothetical protein
MTSIDSVLYDKFSSWYKGKKKQKNIENGELTKSDERVFKGVFFLIPRLLLIPALFFFLKWIFIDFYLTKYGFEKTVIYILLYYLIMKMFLDLILEFMKKQKEF